MLKKGKTAGLKRSMIEMGRSEKQLFLDFNSDLFCSLNKIGSEKVNAKPNVFRHFEHKQRGM